MTSRGNGRQRIFLSHFDCQRFLEQLGHCLDADEVLLYAYCLMPNHFHLFIETPCGNITRFMQRLNTSYSMYFRYKHARPGHCLQGRYGAKLVGGDEYILALTRYIHLNPVKVETFKSRDVARRRIYLNSFKWSSYRGYVDPSGSEDIIDYRWLDLTGLKSSSGKRKAYQRYLEAYIANEDVSFQEALAMSRYAVGDERFVQQAEADVYGQIEQKAVYGDVVEPWDDKVLTADEIMKATSAVYNVTRSSLREHGNRAGIAKGALVELCCRYSGFTQRAIAQWLGYKSESTVGKQRQRLKARLLQDEKEQRRFARAVKSLEKVLKSRV